MLKSYRSACGCSLTQRRSTTCFRRCYGTRRAYSPRTKISSSAITASYAAVEKSLRTWVEAEGGHISSSLSLASGQCGSRGLIASSAVDVSMLEVQSLLVVPRHLHMDNHAAIRVLGPHLGHDARERFSELEQVQQVAACLASERCKGVSSFWGPYIASLPANPPNPWLLSDGDLDIALHQLQGVLAHTSMPQAAADVHAEQGTFGDEGQGAGSQQGPEGTDPAAHWRAAVVHARQHYSGLADEVLEVLGEGEGAGADVAAALGVDKAGLMWALGMVVSRSLGSGRSSGLLPYIDLANHHPGARPPMMQLDDSDRLVFTVTSIRDGELAPLVAGQELFISYQAEDMDPLTAWLKWGFVPDCLPAQQEIVPRG